MQALVVEAPGKATVKEVPRPSIVDGEILVKVTNVALNPTDYKHRDGVAPPGAILGCDFAGIVTETKYPGRAVGDHVAGFVHGGKFEDRGAFAQFLKVKGHRVFTLPMDPAGQATFGVAYITAGMSIFQHHANAYPPRKQSGWFLIQGGSTSVGLFAVQLAKAIGFKVMATASPHSFDLVKSYGADHVVDYHDVNAAVKEIKSVTQDGVTQALECVGGANNARLVALAFGDKGGLATTLLPVEASMNEVRNDVKFERILMYHIGGYSFNFLPNQPPEPAHPETAKWADGFYEETTSMVEKYGIKANPVDLRSGLENIVKGLDELKAGKVSGKKIVYSIASE